MTVNTIEVINNDENIIFDNKNQFKNYYESQKNNNTIKIKINNKDKSTKEVFDFLQMKEKIFIIQDLNFDDLCPIYTCGSEHKSSHTDDYWKYTEEEVDFFIAKSNKNNIWKKEHINQTTMEFIIQKTSESINDTINTYQKNKPNKRNK
jgi:hypothetical protein